MKVVNRFLTGIMLTAGAAFAVVSMSTTPAQATLAQTGVCPSDVGHVGEGGGGVGNASDCNLLISFNANGSISTSSGPQTTYDSIDDSYEGIANNSGGTIFSFNITCTAGTDCFAFDGDGIDLYSGTHSATVAPNAQDNSDGVTGRTEGYWPHCLCHDRHE